MYTHLCVPCVVSDGRGVAGHGNGRRGSLAMLVTSYSVGEAMHDRKPHNWDGLRAGDLVADDVIGGAATKQGISQILNGL